jgi:hypothetical protein
MTTLVGRADARVRTTETTLSRIWLCSAVVASRLIVLAAGVGGALGTRTLGWTYYDPTRISTHLGTTGNLLAATSVRWDSIHYLEIAAHGYSTAKNTVFFPLYPVLIHVLSWIVQSQVIAGVFISTVAFVVSLLLLHRLTVEELGASAAGTAVLLLSLAPLSFFFTAIYTESFFLALSLGCFYLARRGRFGLAALLAAAAALTRVPGVVLVVPLTMMYLQTRGAQLRINLRNQLAGLAAISLPVVALGGFLLYLHTLGYGWLAPVTNQMNNIHGHSLAGPLVTIWRGLTSGLAGLATLGAGRLVEPGLASPFTLGLQNLIYLVVFGIAVASLIAAWRRLPKPYAVYSLLVMTVCIWSPTPDMPLRSIDRYVLVLFPLWMSAAAWLQERRLLRPVLCVSAPLLVFYCVLAARWTFIA